MQSPAHELMTAEAADAAPPEPAIRLDGLVRTFPDPASAGRVRALDGLSVRITGGRVTGVVGADGAGKTTLLRLLAGLLLPDEGRVRVLGGDPAAGDPALRDRLGYMPQSFGLYQELTVAENLRLYADLHGLPGARRAERFEELLAFAGLAPFVHRRAGRLSGGMKQKLGLACTLVQPPEVLLLDEPTVGVDPLSRRELWTIIYRLVEGGMSVVVSTAYLDEAERCAEVLLLHQGRLLEQSAPGPLAGEAAGRTFALSGLDPEARHRLLMELPDQPGIRDVVAQGRRLRVLTDGRIPASPPGLDEARFEPATPRFEDAFIARLLDAGAERESAFDGEAVPAGPGHGDAHALYLSGVSRRFGDFHAVRKVGFQVYPGEIFGLLGPNGAGKSTLIKILCGLLPPSAGEVRVAGVDARKAPAAVRARLGYMSQQFSLYGDLSPTQNLRFFCRAYGLRGRAMEERVARTLAELKLESVAGAASGNLPLGYKQRLALGTALLHRPDIVLLDEPTSGVDPLARRGFWAWITRLAQSGVTVLVTTHFLEEAEYCDRLGIIYAGELAALDTPDGLRERYRGANNPDPTLEDAFVALIEERRREEDGH
ncbi:ATP-binding cassette domain-containing protein [Thiohalorhabdus methylotrophus]|uniref:ATP-binding cassette domain-containing protein n=1 Tax=Thiohalorhabdus methylotrophus TaxID=3242694 RepID=A0ABV4TS92_9GAMM